MDNKLGIVIKIFLLLSLFFFINADLQAQKKIRFSANWSYHDEDRLPGVNRLIGNVIFTQGEIIGYCDSAYFHERENVMEAFGRKVKIHINDSVTLYGKYVIYNGNTKMASISREVVLEDNTSSLYTDSLIYNLNTDVGYYVTGGKMINQDNTLTSKLGRYFTQEQMIYLNENVLLVNETYTMTCDSLAFNTDDEIVHFLSRTHLNSEENDIYTTFGWYDTKQDIAELVKDVIIISETQKITGDSIYYDKNGKLGIGWNNVSVSDSVKNYILNGHYVEYFEGEGVSMATDSAMVVLIDGRDSLFVHADTFKIYIDSLRDVELLKAYYHTKFFREDIQGAADSMVYVSADSLLTLYYNPVIWSEEYQLTGDTIQFFMIDSVRVEVRLRRSGFVVSSIYNDLEFNQIKGINITGHIYDKKLKKVDVIGNAECLYYIQEDDASLIGVNSSATSEMKISFVDNQIQTITKYNEPDGKIYPDQLLEENDKRLKDFRWLETYRARRVEDIFHTPIPRIKGSEPGAGPFSDRNR